MQAKKTGRRGQIWDAKKASHTSRKSSGEIITALVTIGENLTHEANSVPKIDSASLAQLQQGKLL
jgi:hypothetical protein